MHNTKCKHDTIEFCEYMCNFIGTMKQSSSHLNDISCWLQACHLSLSYYSMMQPILMSLFHMTFSIYMMTRTVIQFTILLNSHCIMQSILDLLSWKCLQWQLLNSGECILFWIDNSFCHVYEVYGFVLSWCTYVHIFVM